MPARSGPMTKPPAYMEGIVRQARETFGDTLPANFLSPDEYIIYERLYGPPTHTTRPEDVRQFQSLNKELPEGLNDMEERGNPRDALLRENSEGAWEKVDYQLERGHDEENYQLERGQEEVDYQTERGQEEMDYQIERGQEEVDYQIEQGQEEVNSNLDQEPVYYQIETRQEGENLNVDQESVEDTLEGVAEVDEAAIEIGEEESLIKEYNDDFRARIALYKDIIAANQALEPDETPPEDVKAAEEDRYSEEEQEESETEEYDNEDLENLEDFNETSDEQGDSRASRFHHLTTAGKSGTTPSTIQIPKATVLDPITALLADASNKQLREVAHKVFGGSFLPNSTATPNTRGTHLRQQPIALNASQSHMGAMEANAYVAANIPGTYAAVASTLEEVRKRVHAGWLKNLLAKEGGPRILDAGGGGAGVLAWRELLRDEWKRLHPNSMVEGNPPPPTGKSTIVTGSPTLRQRVSQLLENSTFLPRLPDYNPSLDHPSLENPKATPRKRYDIIVAPHTLWSVREDYMRKNQVQNLWSLLDPNGGILIIIEKGVPRGFELVAGAREVLLKHHIASPGSETAENHIGEPLEDLSREKERGMIIAPCTNHLKCPLYLEHGANTGRKDFCHFSQRFNRPAFLQRLIGQSGRNHEDVGFSYIAVQRGIDRRQELGIPQGLAATNAAFAGYESETPDAVESSSSHGNIEPSSLKGDIEPDSQLSQLPFVHPLSLPRLVLPPLKRDKHVIFDVCTPTGKLERWTVPRSFSKQGYRDARKARWGDLWALGAKTRVPRNVRIGEKKRKTKEKRNRGLTGGRDRDDDEEDNLTMLGGGGGLFDKQEQRTKRRRTAKARPGRKKDLDDDDDDDVDLDEDEDMDDERL